MAVLILDLAVSILFLTSGQSRFCCVLGSKSRGHKPDFPSLFLLANLYDCLRFGYVVTLACEYDNHNVYKYYVFPIIVTMNMSSFLQ